MIACAAIISALVAASSSVMAAPCIAPIQRTGKFIHITDIHIDSDYLNGSDPAQLCHRKNDTDATKNTAGMFGALGSQCDTPFPLLDASFNFMKTNDATKDVDFIIHTGDTARHDRDTLRVRTEAMVISDLQTVTAYFNKTFDLSRTRVFPTIGNNDPFGHNDEAPGPSTLLTNLTSIWKPY
ncbi:Endopolyphosphatase, partial [Blyttiomyces sp. JEL0837]